MNDVSHKYYSIDAVELTSLAYVSSLIGGRGRWPAINSSYPLAEYWLQNGGTQRFRLAHSGAEYSYKVSADDHVLELVALDGKRHPSDRCRFVHHLPRRERRL